MNYSQKDITYHLNKSENIALKILEQKARKILTQHPNLNEFVMGMGGWSFWDKKDNRYTDNEVSYLVPFANFIIKYDNYLKLTGNPMRFTAKGKIIKNW